MGRPGLSRNRKFRRLAHSLGSTSLARGSLELIWDGCYEAGDDYLGSDQDVELAACWEGSPGVLVRALAEAGGEGTAGFIEPDPERPGWRVYHLFENAPDYVQKRMVRELERKRRGKTISDLRRDAGKKGRAAQLARQTAANGGETWDTCPAIVEQVAANGDTPAPAPAPVEMHSDADASVGENTEAIDPRHAQIRQLIQELHLQRFRVKCQWDGSEGKALDRLLSANPSWTEDQLAEMVSNRFESDGINSDRPRKWLPNLGSYAAGPQDRFNKLKGPPSHGNGNGSRAEQRQAANLAACAEAKRSFGLVS